VKVYDITLNEWKTYDDLAEKYHVSDHTGFGNDKYAYFVGGYNETYIAMSNVFRIDTENTVSSNSLVVEDRTSLKFARGDVSGTTDDAGTYAIVSGGFSHENDFCDPLDSVERYDFATNAWTDLPPLGSARSDKVLVELNKTIFAIGGERQIENVCSLSNDTTPEPGELTVAVDDVERLDFGASEWITIADLPFHRFRFPAVGFDDDEEIYTFGGQKAYDKKCQCFRTSNEIIIYKEVSSAWGIRVGSMWGFSAALAAFFM